MSYTNTPTAITKNMTNNHFQNLKNQLIEIKIIKKSDKLTIKAETEKAQLFAINDAPLFWVPKSLVKKKGRTFFINKCFNIKKEMTYQGG